MMATKNKEYSSELLNERGKTHGDWYLNASLSQAMKETLREGESYYKLSVTKHEALDMICNKLARAVNGDPDEIDHWKDIAGYATLVVERG